MPKLTDRQRAFCHNLAEGMSATEAARRAGYSETYANREAAKLVVKPQVTEYLESLREAARTNAVMSLRELQEWWTSLIRPVRPGDETRDALRASELLAKSHGGFTDKTEVTLKRDPRDMTTQELEEYLHARGLLE